MIGVLFDILLYPSRLVGIADWVTIVVSISTAFWFWSTANYRHWDGRGIRVWKPFPFIGAIVPFIRRGMIGADEDTAAECGNTVRGTFFGRTPVLEVFDAEMIKSVCIKQFSHFVNHNQLIEMQGKYIKHFLTVIKDDQWKGMRNVVTPTFSGAKMKMLVPCINDCADKFIANLTPYAIDGTAVDTKLMAGHFALDTVAASLFGVAIDSHAEAADAKARTAIDAKYKDDSFSAHANAVFNGGGAMTKILAFVMIMFPASLRNWLLRMDIGRDAFGQGEHWMFFANFVERLIDMRESNKEQAQKRVDCLSLLLDAHKADEMAPGDEVAMSSLDTTKENADRVRDWKIGKRELLRDEIVANAMLFYLAGFETTATTIAWTMYNLAANPEAQQMLFAEIDEKCDANTPLTYDLISSMSYLDAVINETLRMYPPAVRTDRLCNKACTIGDLNLVEGDWLMFSIWAIHHNERHWPQSFAFRPERFLDDEKDAIVPCTFLPFGIGPRNCVGQRLAYLEMKVALIRVIREFEFTVDTSKTAIPPVLAKSTQMTAAVNGIHLFVKQR